MARYPQGGGMSAAGRERREQVRLQAAEWFGEGRPSAWVAAELRVGLRQVEKWRRAWRRGGAEALRSRGPHRRPRLDDAAFAQLEAELNRGPSMRAFIDAHADWLTVFYLPAYAPELNPAESVWSRLKRSMANFLATDLDHLTIMIKHRLKVIQHHPDVIDGCLTTTGLTHTTTPAITN